MARCFWLWSTREGLARAVGNENFEDVTSVKVTLVWDPPWDLNEMCSDAAKDQLGIW